MIVASIAIGFFYAVYFLISIFAQISQGNTTEPAEIGGILLKMLSFALFVSVIVIGFSRC